jgi:hypothetical protein
MDPLSLLCRLATSVPPPRFHTVKYAGVLASASPWRRRVAPRPTPAAPELATAGNTDATKSDAARAVHTGEGDQPPRRRGTYRPWAELLKRTFAVDVLECPKCNGRMRLLAMLTDPGSIRRYLTGTGELTDVPERSPSRGPPFWKSTVLRRHALGDAA